MHAPHSLRFNDRIARSRITGSAMHCYRGRAHITYIRSSTREAMENASVDLCDDAGGSTVRVNIGRYNSMSGLWKLKASAKWAQDAITAPALRDCTATHLEKTSKRARSPQP